MKEERNKTLQQQMTDKYHHFQVVTLSATDMKWPEVIQSIAKQYGTIYTEQEVLELPWRLKSMWLRSNPVTSA